MLASYMSSYRVMVGITITDDCSCKEASLDPDTQGERSLKEEERTAPPEDVCSGPGLEEILHFQCTAVKSPNS